MDAIRHVRRRGDSNMALTVLLVEDDDNVRESVALALAVKGYEVIQAASAESALVASAGQVSSIDIVLTDVVLPQMSGVELVRRLLAQRADLVTLFTSGYPESVVREQGMALGEVRFLRKPFSIGTLERAIRARLGENRVEN